MVRIDYKPPMPRPLTLTSYQDGPCPKLAPPRQVRGSGLYLPQRPHDPDHSGTTDFQREKTQAKANRTLV